MQVMQREILHCTWRSVGRHQSCEKKKIDKLAVEHKASNNNISNYLSTKNISEVEKQLSLLAQEAIFAYHIAVHNHSFNSMDCMGHFEGKCDLEECTVDHVFMNSVVPDLSLNEDDLLDELPCVQNIVKAN
jgi:hypothetical protein